jgi:hypothetical protein
VTVATFVEVRSGDGKTRHGWIRLPIEARQISGCRVWLFDVGPATVRLEISVMWDPEDDRKWWAFNGGEMSLDALRLIPGFVTERRYLAGETNGKVEKGTEDEGAEAGQAGVA